MKINIKNTSLFSDDKEAIRDFFRSFTLSASVAFGVHHTTFDSLLGVFELSLVLNRGSDHLTPTAESAQILLNWLCTLEPTVAKDIFKRANTYCREANDSFWAMQNSNPMTSNDYSFKENTEKCFDTINRILEYMVVKEGYLLPLSQSGSDITLEKFSLFETVESCTAFLSRDPILTINNDTLLQIPLNQWRNISAHKDFSCCGGKIEVSYGKGIIKKSEFSFEDLNRACMEIYRLRVNLKLIVGMALFAFGSKNMELTELVQYSPKTFLHDINYILDDYGIQLDRFESSEELMLKGEKFEIPEGFSLFDVKFTYSKHTNEEVCVLILGIAKILSSIFGEHNNLPPKEQIILHFISLQHDSEFHMIYDYNSPNE